MTFKTRFAPSPTGPLHLGHAYSAAIAAQEARKHQGKFILRIEDLDASRSRPKWEEAIFDDLNWLGIEWETPVLRQSERAPAYQSAVSQLTDMGLTYVCTCRRADIEAAASAPQENVPQFGPDGRIYPGTCRDLGLAPSAGAHVIRLNMAKAAAILSECDFRETGPLYTGRHRVNLGAIAREVGDIILVRREMSASYHLSVVVDDAFQDITQITRGADLWEATQIHVLLQALLGLSTPDYHHHDLIRDESGKRLAKRDDARAIATYRAEGATPESIFRALGLSMSPSAS